MIEFLTNDQIIWAKNHCGSSTKNIDLSEGLGTLLNLGVQSKTLLIRSGEINTFQKKGKRIKPTPVVIVAGDTDKLTKKTLSKYYDLLIDTFQYFTGTIISGGTTAGVCRIVGDIQEKYRDTIRTIGYLPAIIPANAQTDLRYYEYRNTDGDLFSVKEPLQYWIDILASGIPPAEVKLIGIGGGDISAAEYRIALLLGAKVGILENSGRAAEELFEDPEWNTSENLITLPHDGATLRAFIGFGAGFRNNRIREELAQHIHEEYQRMQFSNPQTDPSSLSLVTWKDQDPGLKDSNRNQADHIFVKLWETRYTLRKVKKSNPVVVSFTSEEVELLAELEHGRWNAERLLAGWRHGPVKDVATKISPYIVPWAILPEEVRVWDRDPVRHLPAMLASMGYEIFKDSGEK